MGMRGLSVSVGTLLVGLMLAAAGCASDNKSASGNSATRGMMCPKCETVWMNNVEGQGTKMQRFTTSKGMTCPDCDAMAKAYFQGDDIVLHDCPTCKVKPMELSSGNAPSTHQRGTH